MPSGQQNNELWRVTMASSPKENWMNNETSNPMPESAAASPEAEPVKKTRKPRAAKADGAKDAVEAKKPAAPRKRAGVKKDAAAEVKPARKRVTKPRAEEAVAVEEPVQPVAEQEVQSSPRAMTMTQQMPSSRRWLRKRCRSSWAQGTQGSEHRLCRCDLGRLR
jgi:hypothetical protein